MSARQTTDAVVEVAVQWGSRFPGLIGHGRWHTRKGDCSTYTDPQRLPSADLNAARDQLIRLSIYSLDPRWISEPVELHPNMTLDVKGGGLSCALDRLRDQWPEQFESLNQELYRWVPEFDLILFETTGKGQRFFCLRTRIGGYSVPAHYLLDGTLSALTLLTIAYLPDSPALLGLEEPDRGIHPRLLRDVHDAIHRLSYPEISGEQRQPVQVIVTTHLPYMLELFRDQTEEVVVAQRVEDNVSLSD